MCLNFVFGKYGYLKYLFPSPEWLHDRVVASHREKEDNEEGGVFQQDQGRHHFNQIISKFRGLGALGQGEWRVFMTYSCLFPELFYVLLFYLQKEITY